MATFGSQADYYSGHAALYSDSQIRPRYPPELFETIFSFAGTGADSALDVATGTGQSARQLATRYQQVWAVDANEEQIKQCRPHPRITFRKGCAESTGLPDSSVDLVTAAAALHWLDCPAFYKEARRVLKPGGALAAWCYSLPQIKDCARANKFFNEFWETKLGPHKADAHIIWERQYRGFEPGEDEFGVVERATQTFEQKSSIWHLVAFIRTSGLYGKMVKETPGQPDPLPPFSEQLISILNAADDSMELTLEYPVFMILAKDPMPL